MPTDFGEKNQRPLFEGDEQTARLILAQAKAGDSQQGGSPIAKMQQQCMCREGHGGAFVRNNCYCR